MFNQEPSQNDIESDMNKLYMLLVLLYQIKKITT